MYGRSEDETPRKCILQAENIMPGSKKLWEEHLFPSEKIVFSPFGRKNNHFFLGKQKFASEFFCPWHNVSTQKEHIFPFSCNTYFLSFSSGLLLPLTKDRQSTRALFEKSINKFDAKKWHLSSSNNTGFEPIYGEVSHDDVFLTTKSG